MEIDMMKLLGDLPDGDYSIKVSMPEYVEIFRTKTISINDKFPVTVDLSGLTRDKIYLDIDKENLNIYYFANVTGAKKIEIKGEGNLLMEV